MKCEYCEIISGDEKAEIIYQDDDVLAFVKEDAITPGQITVIPKEHFTILEMIPNKLLSKMVNVSNKLGMAIFDTMGVQGTNILVENGLGAGQTVPHFAMHIVPRKENDGIGLQWEPQQLLPEELEEDFIQIQSNAKEMSISDEEPKKEVTVSSGKTEVVLEDEGDNYLLKSLKKRP